MKIFHKEVYPNGRRHIYILGLKILSYKGEAIKKETNEQISFNQSIVLSANTSDGITDFQYNYLKSYFSSVQVRQRFETDVCLFLTAITGAYLRKDMAFASAMLTTYINRFGFTAFESYPWVCVMAQEIGLGNEKTNEYAKKYQEILRIRSYERFEKMVLAAKTIAVVGRSPILLGKGLGKEIDAHDIVIRFNGSDVSGKFGKDYGVKINVNVINMFIENTHQENVCCIYKDVKSYGLVPEIIDKIEHDLNNNIDIIDQKLKYYTVQKSGLAEPTSGTLFIVWLQKILGNLNNVDFYGFAFQDPDKSVKHFDNDEIIKKQNHDFDSEIEFLKYFIKEHKFQ